MCAPILESVALTRFQLSRMSLQGQGFLYLIIGSPDPSV